MGVTEGSWRLKALIFCIVMPMILYGVEGFFLGATYDIGVKGQNNTGALEGFNESNIADTRSEGVESGGDFLSIIGFIWEFATFQAIEDTPEWASWFITLFVISMGITLMYLAYTFIYEIIKALPFT